MKGQRTHLAAAKHLESLGAGKKSAFHFVSTVLQSTISSASSEASSNLQRFDGIHFGYRAEGLKTEDVYVKSQPKVLIDQAPNYARNVQFIVWLL